MEVLTQLMRFGGCSIYFSQFWQSERHIIVQVLSAENGGKRTKNTSDLPLFLCGWRGAYPQTPSSLNNLSGPKFKYWTVIHPTLT